MSETIYEFVTSQGADVRVDAAAGVIRGVKVLGQQSRNGRRYLPQALCDAIALYEGAKVNVNHPKGQPTAPRDYQDRIGVIRSVRLGVDGCLYADFHFNPKHALAEQLTWDAQHAPENVGFSHNVEARTSRAGAELTVEAITRVQSVDLVADPGTTRGLFEGQDDPTASRTATDRDRVLESLTADELARVRPDLVEQLQCDGQDESAQLREELAQLEIELRRSQRRDLARQWFVELAEQAGAETQRLDVASLGSEFMRLVESAESDAEARRLIEAQVDMLRRLGQRVRGGSPERNGLGRPRSRGPSWIHGADAAPDNARDFARAIA
ncbi:MAG: hypothetical protein KDA63_02905 [Planctomycetales bacterium]|nr:hypothetical protein [Planctomycetales bacterium]